MDSMAGGGAGVSGLASSLAGSLTGVVGGETVPRAGWSLPDGEGLWQGLWQGMLWTFSPPASARHSPSPLHLSPLQQPEPRAAAHLPGLFRYLFRRFARAATLAFGLSFLVVRLGRSGCDVFAFGSFLLGVFARTTRLAPFGVPVFRRFLFFLPDAGYTDSLLVEYFVNKFLFGH